MQYICFAMFLPIQQYSIHHIIGQSHVILEVALRVRLKAVGDVSAHHLPLARPPRREGLDDHAQRLQVVQVFFYGLVSAF